MATWTQTIQATESGTTTSIKITVDGVPENATGITVDKSAKTVTIPTSLLGTSNVTISTESATVTGETVGEYSTDDTSKFKLSVDLTTLSADQKVVSTAAAWTHEGTTATYAQTVKPKYKKTDDYTITYVEAGDGAGTSETLATITNVIGTPNAPDAEGVILVPQNIFGEANIVLDDKGNNYTLQDPTYTQGATEYAWVANGDTEGSFKYQSTTAKNYTLAQDAKSITYTAPVTLDLATISGLADTATATALSTPGASGAITVQGTALKDGDVTLTNANGSNFTLAVDGLSDTQNGTVTYEVTYPEDSGKYTATYTKKTADNYTASGTKITRTTTADETLATVTGLATNSGVTVDEASTVITVPEAAFDKTNGNEVAVDKGKGTYTLATAVEAPKATGTKAFAFNTDKNIEYQQPMTAGAVVSEDASKITYKKAYNDVLATISGLKDQQGLSTAGSDLATAVTIDANNVITIKEAALNGADATLETTGDYTLALDKLTAATSIISSAYAVSSVTGGTATIQQTDTVRYKVADGAKAIQYDAETGFTATPTEVAKITGLLTSATSGVEVAATADATSKKYDVTVHLAALTTAGGATLTNTDKFVLKLDKDTQTITEYEFKVTTDGTPKAVYQSFKKSNYTTDGTTITKVSAAARVADTEQTLATITGLKATAATSNFKAGDAVDGVTTITVEAAALVETGEIKIEGTNYKIDVDNSKAITTGTPAWTAGTGDDEGKAIYQRIDKVKYQTASDGKSITYKADGYELEPAVLATITGIKTDAFTTERVSVGDAVEGVTTITVKSAALDGKDVSIDGDGYKLALDTQTKNTVYEWSVKDGKATYTKYETVNYILKDGKILYSATGRDEGFATPTVLAELDGVNAELNGKTATELDTYFTVDNTASSKKITVKAGALTKGDVSLTLKNDANYALALDANTASTVDEWNYDASTNTTAHYQTVLKSNYVIATEDSVKKIKYLETLTDVGSLGSDSRYVEPKTAITFTGIKEGLEPTALQEAFNIGTTADTTDGKKTVTVKNAALGEAPITTMTKGDGYKVALEEQTPDLSNEWTVATSSGVTTATYKDVSTVKYTKESDTQIKYTADGVSTKTELFKVSGIKDIKTDGTYQPSAITEITVKGNVVTLNKAALTANKDKPTVTLTGEGYTLAIGADVAYIGKKSDGTTAVENEWQGSGSGEAQYIQPVVTNYTLGEGSKTINYSEEATATDPVVLATIKGLSNKITKTTSADDLADMFVVTPGVDQKYTIELKGSAITGSTYITSQNGKHIINGESGAGSTYKDTTITLDLYTVNTDPDYVVNDIAGNTKKWSFNGTKATYDSVKSPTYTFAKPKTVEGGTTAADGNNTIQITGGKGNTNTLTNIITVNGINAAYDTTTNPFTIDGTTVKVAAAALGTSTFTLENKGNTEYSLAIDGTGVITYGKHEAGKESAAPTWLVKGGVATYYTADSFDAEKEWGYKIVDNDAAKKTITYTAPTLAKGATPTITVSGIANIAPNATGNVPGLTYTGSGNVTVSYDALAKKNVTISSKANDVKLAIRPADLEAYGAESDAEFKIYTTTTTPAAATGGDPLLDGSGEETESAAATSDIKAEDITNGGVLTVKQSIKKGYTISADSGAIFFTSKANGDTVTLANVTGLNKEAVKGTDYTIDETNGKITLLTDKALAEKAVKVTTGHYTLELDDDVTEAETDAAAHWTLDKAGTTATYQLKTSAGYTLSDDGKSIAYAKDPTYEVYTKISGLSSNLRATIDATITGLTKPTEETIKAVADNVTAIEAARAAAIAALPATATEADEKAAGDKAAAEKLDELLKAAEAEYQEDYDAAFAEKLDKYFTIGTAASADKPAPITIDAAAFGSSNITIKNSKGHSYSLAVPAEGISTEAPTESSGWYVNGASLSIQTNTGAYYELDEKAEKITYHKAAIGKGSKPAVTISGLKAGLTVNTDGTITGIGAVPTTKYANGKYIITLSASVLNDKTVKISAGSDKADYKLALDSTTVTTSTVADTWEYASSTLSLTQGQTEGYVLSDDGTTATYYNGKTGAKVVAKIKGLTESPLDADGNIKTFDHDSDASTAEIPVIKVDSVNKIITINDKTLLGSSVEFVGKSDYTLAVGSDINSGVTPEYSWTVDEKKKTATYQMTLKADMYVVENGKIVKKTATPDKPETVDLITIKGLKTVSGTKTEAAATTDLEKTIAAVDTTTSGIVKLKADALGTAKVTATGSYKLELDTAVNTDKTVTDKDWLIKGTTATYEDVYKEAYTLSDKGDSVTYTAAKKVLPKQEATITLSNLKSGVTASDIDYNESTKTITLGANAIGTNPKKPTTVSSGYTLAIDPTLESAKKTSASVYKGNSVTYTVEQSAGYTLANNAITYAKPVTAKLITISGLAKFLTDADISAGVIVDDTAYQADNTKPITVTVSEAVLKQTLNKAGGTELTTPILSKSVKVTAGKDLDGKTKPTVTLSFNGTQTTDNIWYLDGANAKYINAYTTAHYDLDSTQTKLTYVATAKPTLGATAAITVTGLDKKLAKSETYKTLNLGDNTSESSAISESGGTVTIDTSVLDKKSTITASGAEQLANGGYTLDFKSGGETLHEAKDAEATWTLGKKAVLKQDQAQGYTLSIDGKTITYQSAAKTGRNAVTVASINGLADKNTVVETSGTNHDIIELTTTQLTNKVTVDSIGYTFKFDDTYSGTGDTAKKMNTITGGKNIDKIEAGGNYLNITTAAGNDVIKVTGENNIINGGKGDDYIEVTGGSNTITYANGDGNDIIKGIGATDQINLAVFTKAELEKVDKKTKAPVNYVTYETSGSDTVLTLVKNKKTVGTITLKDTSSLSNVKLYPKDGKEFSYEITPTAVSTASGSSGFIGSGNVADEFYSTNYATGSNLGDIISGDSTFSVGDIETGNATDLAKNNTPIITGSNKK